MSGAALQSSVELTRGSFGLEVSLSLPGEGVTALVGPSGSGKSTLLRAIAGLERPRRGRIALGDTVWFDGRLGINRPARQRRVGYMFQEYALFGHLSVAANVGFGLPRRQREERVRAWLERLHLAELAERRPHQLSGGQRQRVALARALAPEPAVLLLDEPFSAVDASLRQYLRTELRGELASLRRPVLLVTHDLEDVRRMADRVGVMVEGRLHAFGSRAEVFRNPVTVAAARVLGWPNLLPIEQLRGDEAIGPWGRMALSRSAPSDACWLGIRPEHLRLGDTHEAGLDAHFISATDLGALCEVECRLGDGHSLLLHLPAGVSLPAPGAMVRVVADPGTGVALSESPPILSPTGANMTGESEWTEEQLASYGAAQCDRPPRRTWTGW